MPITSHLDIQSVAMGIVRHKLLILCLDCTVLYDQKMIFPTRLNFFIKVPLFNGLMCEFTDYEAVVAQETE